MRSLHLYFERTFRLLWLFAILCLARCESENENENATTNDVCMTAVCKAEAETIRLKLDVTVDPCDDFYLFACGTFINETIVPADKTHYDVTTVLDEQIRQQLNDVLNASVTEQDIYPFVMSKKLYQACLNEGLNKSSRSVTLLKLVPCRYH